MKQPGKRISCPHPGCNKMIRARNEACREHKDWHSVSKPPISPDDFKQTRICVGCGSQFRITSSQSKYCQECRIFSCKVCGNLFCQSPSDSMKTCPNCRGQLRKAPTLICQFCGNPFPQRGGRPTKYCGKECRYAAARKIHSKPNHRTWQYKRWRRQVFKRDNYTCQDCEATTKLQSHHLQSINEYPALAYTVNNGITLCTDCHTLAHGGRPTNQSGANRLACSICGDAITGRGKSPYCKSCAMRVSTQAKRQRQSLKRNSSGQFTSPSNKE